MFVHDKVYFYNETISVEKARCNLFIILLQVYELSPSGSTEIVWNGSIGLAQSHKWISQS